MFKNIYEKFSRMANQYDLISKDTGKIVIATSGGKDANAMTLLLHEYKKKERPDLELELATVVVPAWKYKPDTYYDKINDEEKKQILINEREHIDNHKQYWKERGIESVEIEGLPGIDDNIIYDSSSPCTLCFVAAKKALFKYLENHDNKKEVRVATGMIKGDVVYAMVSQILRSGGKTWQQIKKDNPKKHKMNCMHIGTFCPYPKANIGIPNKTVYSILPIIGLSDYETKYLSTEFQLPVIPDPCIKLFGDKFQSDKRHFDRFQRTTAVEELNFADNQLDPLFPDYEKLLEMFNKTGLLPPAEEMDGIMYEAYFQELMTAVILEHK